MSFEQDYLILDAIDRHRPRNQRELANSCGLSLGKTNYVLRKLLNEGLVKTSALEEDSNKTSKRYFLTPEGTEAKALLSGSFIKVRMKEFEDFRNRLLENLLSLQEEGVDSLLVLGSESVGKLLSHIARRENLVIRIVGTASTSDHFSCFDTESYDRILFAQDQRDCSELLETGIIPEDKVTYLK
jgi:DNA-binding MarR family transcriptional regulator